MRNVFVNRMSFLCTGRMECLCERNNIVCWTTNAECPYELLGQYGMYMYLLTESPFEFIGRPECLCERNVIVY
jgi:hypothetical protein